MFENRTGQLWYYVIHPLRKLFPKIISRANADGCTTIIIITITTAPAYNILLSITGGTYYTAAGTICAWISLRYSVCLSSALRRGPATSYTLPATNRTLPRLDHPLIRHYPSYNIRAAYATTAAAASKRVYKSYIACIRWNASWRHGEKKFFRFDITDTSRLRRRVLHGRSHSPPVPPPWLYRHTRVRDILLVSRRIVI